MKLGTKNQIPDLADQKTLAEFKRYLEVIERFDQPREARQLSDVILWLLGGSPDFPQKHPDLFEEYQTALIRSRWVALPLLSEGEITEMFEKYLLEGLTMVDFDILEKLKIKSRGLLLLEERDKLKKQIYEAMVRNKQLLGMEKITTSNERREQTISNWLKDFTAETGGDILDVVKRNEYFVKNKNVSLLSETERNLFQQIAEIYSFCHLSSFELRGLEDYIPVDADDRKGVIIQGKFEEIKPSEEKRVAKLITEAIEISNQVSVKEKTALTAKEREEILVSAYLGTEEEREKIHGMESKITKASQGDIDRIGGILIESINKGEKFPAVAALRLLAQQTDLVQFLQNNERFYNLAKEYIKINYSDTIQSDFERKKFAPPYLSVFLQYLFRNKLKMTSEESARLGIQLEGLIVKKSGKEMQGMVYGDLEKGVYVWHEVKDVGTRLELFKEV